MSSTVTFIFYLVIILMTTMLGFFSQYKTKTGKTIFIPLFFWLSFTIHFVVAGFTKIGTDYDSYYKIIDSLDWNRLSSSVEITFDFIALLLKQIFKSPDIVLFIFKVLTVFLFYLSFYRFKEKMKIYLSIFAYNAFIFFQFYIVGMNISIALLLLSVVLLLDGRILKSLVLFILAATTHSSSWLFLPVYLIIVSILKWHRSLIRFVVLIMVLMYFIVITFHMQIYNFLVYNFQMFYQYRFYDQIINYSGTGIFQYVNFAFIGIFIYLIYKHFRYKDKTYCLSSILLTVNAFFFALLAYRFNVLIRINKSSFFIYSIFVPVLLYNYSHNKEYIKGYFPTIITKNNLIEMMWGLYITFNCILVISEIFSSGSTSSMNQYVFSWPFI